MLVTIWRATIINVRILTQAFVFWSRFFPCDCIHIRQSIACRATSLNAGISTSRFITTRNSASTPIFLFIIYIWNSAGTWSWSGGCCCGNGCCCCCSSRCCGGCGWEDADCLSFSGKLKALITCEGHHLSLDIRGLGHRFRCSRGKIRQWVIETVMRLLPLPEGVITVKKCQEIQNPNQFIHNFQNTLFINCEPYNSVSWGRVRRQLIVHTLCMPNVNSR